MHERQLDHAGMCLRIRHTSTLRHCEYQGSDVPDDGQHRGSPRITIGVIVPPVERHPTEPYLEHRACKESYTLRSLVKCRSQFTLPRWDFFNSR
jgi:hypothetical protein